MSTREIDRATEKLSYEIKELLLHAEKVGVLSRFERRILRDTFHSMKSHAENVALGIPSIPAYAYSFEALEVCRRLRAIDRAA